MFGILIIFILFAVPFLAVVFVLMNILFGNNLTHTATSRYIRPYLLANNCTLVKVEKSKISKTGAFDKDLYMGWFKIPGGNFYLYRDMYYYENFAPDTIHKLTARIRARNIFSVIEVTYKPYG